MALALTPSVSVGSRFTDFLRMNSLRSYGNSFSLVAVRLYTSRMKHWIIEKFRYCSNQARAGMNPKTLQYLMGHSEIGVTMNTYTHLGLDDAKDEMIRLEELEQARKEIDKTNGEKPMKQIMFKAI